MNRARRFLALLLAAASLTACVTPTALPTAPAVDLSRYCGTWYEIARLPNRFQAMCVSDAQAVYRPDGEDVSVVNQCRPFYGDYWILELDPAYRWVLIGEPGRRVAWILARQQPALDDATLARLLDRAAALGFDRQAFVRTRHADTPR